MRGAVLIRSEEPMLEIFTRAKKSLIITDALGLPKKLQSLQAHPTGHFVV